MNRTILTATLLGTLCACSVETDVGEEDTVGVDAGSDSGDGDDGDGAGQPDGAPGAIDLTEYCNQWNTSVCGQLFACFSQDERDAMGVPPTEGECVSAQAPDCEDASSETACSGAEVFQADQTTPCLTQFAALTCEQFRNPDHDAVLAEFAPACVAMCQ